MSLYIKNIGCYRNVKAKDKYFYIPDSVFRDYEINNSVETNGYLSTYGDKDKKLKVIQKLPFNKISKTNFNRDEALKELDKSHLGLEEVKSQIAIYINKQMRLEQLRKEKAKDKELNKVQQAYLELMHSQGYDVDFDLNNPEKDSKKQAPFYVL